MLQLLVFYIFIQAAAYAAGLGSGVYDKAG